MSDGVKRRGFGSMDPARRKELAIKGGKAIPGEKRSFFKDRKLASAAGRKGGRSKADAARKG